MPEAAGRLTFAEVGVNADLDTGNRLADMSCPHKQQSRPHSPRPLKLF